MIIIKRRKHYESKYEYCPNVFHVDVRAGYTRLCAISRRVPDLFSIMAMEGGGGGSF